MLYRNFIGGLILLFGSQFAAAASSFEQMVDAVKTDKPDVVNSLLKRGFDPNTSDREGNTLLMMAAKEGSNGVVKQLLAMPRAADAGGADFHGQMLASPVKIISARRVVESVKP